MSVARTLRPEPASAGLAWRPRVDGALPGSLNMARDHALARTLASGAGVLRLYRWERPTLSLGRNEPARGRYDPEAMRARGFDLVRRPTGGRAVLHWRELTYAVAAPARALGGPRRAYRWIHERLAEALGGLGLEVALAPDPDRASGPDAGPCFGRPAGGEILADGRKLVGSAQLRVGDALLQHGSILIADDQGWVAELGGGPRATATPAAAVSDLLGRSLDEGELERAVLGAFGVGGASLAGTADRSASPLELELEARYRSEAWTWRR